MKLKQIKEFLRNKPGYLKKSSKVLRDILQDKGYDVTKKDCQLALTKVRTERVDRSKSKSMSKHATNKDVFVRSFVENLKVDKLNSDKDAEKKNKNVLVIGDIHLPFSLDGYLEHCKKAYKEYDCNEVVFIGDIIDNHASSYHETDPDGMNAGQELTLAINQVKEWYKAFPKATVIIGNHDRLIMRKAYSSGLSRHWIRDYSEVLNVPNWKFKESIEIDDVLYVHGEGGTARTKIKADLQSVVQGHLHTQCYTEWLVGSKFKIFGMQVGCGIDHKSYAMAYAKSGKKPAIACGVVLQGKIPINLMMEL